MFAFCKKHSAGMFNGRKEAEMKTRKLYSSGICLLFNQLYFAESQPTRANNFISATMQTLMVPVQDRAFGGKSKKSVGKVTENLPFLPCRD